MKKRKRTTENPSPTPEPTPIPSLPDDLLVSCLARVSRLYYPNLSFVSKRFRSLLNSPELYATRSYLDQTESCLYVCLKFRPDLTPRWFTLCRKPIRTLTKDTTTKKKKKSEGYALATVPMPNSPPLHCTGLVSVGSDIYNIGGSIYKEPLSKVLILDCRSNTWREAPSMCVKRYNPAAGVVDGKIYVAGGCEECDNSNWMEVFDPKTGTWERVSSRGLDICGCSIEKSAGIDGKVYVFGSRNGLAYEPSEGKWENVGLGMYLGWHFFSSCVVETLIYSYFCGVFKWYDTEVRVWRYVEGLKGLPNFANYASVKLADYGGKMAVLWDKYLPSSKYKKKTICCAVIALERWNSGVVWGKVEWHDAVHIVPESYEFVCALSATV